MNIVHEPAECWSACTDLDCPYVHKDVWYVIEEDTGYTTGPFYTREEAVAHNKKHIVDINDLED